MRNKLIYSFIVFGFTVLHGIGQTNTTSPYSRYGYGLERQANSLRNFAMAGSGIALKSKLHVNPLNPASYHALTLTTFEAGFEMDNIWLQGSGQSQFQNNSYFSHLLFGIPIKEKRWGMVFGMMPLTSVGYDYQSQSELDPSIGTVTNSFEGSGGANQLIFGHGFTLLTRDSASLSFGVNASYILGRIERNERIIYEDLSDAFNSRKTDEISFGDVRFDFGLQYQKKLNADFTFVGGLTYALQDKVSGKRNSVTESYTGNVGFENIKDTISLVDDKKEQFEFPASYGLGFSLVKDNKWVGTLDLNLTQWSGVNIDSTIEVSNAYGVRMGFEIDRGDTRKKDGKLRVYDMKSRYGARYRSSFITIQGEQLEEYALSFGISFYGLSRVGVQRMIRGMNFGMEIGTRGKDNGVMFQEQFLNFMVGISINDRWFIKRKYD